MKSRRIRGEPVSGDAPAWTTTGGAELGTSGETVWRIALGAILVSLGLVAVAALLLPQVRALIGGSWGVIVAPVEGFCARHCPSALQPIVAQGAEVLLSPWLYLVMGIVFVAEKAMPAIRSQPVFSVGMIQDFLGWFILGGFVRVLLIGAFVSGVYWFCDHTLSGIRWDAVTGWPTWAAAGVAILAGDFLNWFHHWLRHRVGVFWLFHTIHHSQKQMNMFTDLRVHLVEYVIARPISIIPLYWVGLDIPTAFWLSLVLESYTRVYHANLRTDFGPLRHLLVTPQSHRIHHSADPRHWGHNFGVLFTFWDRIFGTQWKGYDEYPETGVPDGRYPHESSVGGLRIFTNYLRQLLFPFELLTAGERDCVGGAGMDTTSAPSRGPAGESGGLAQPERPESRAARPYLPYREPPESSS